jgi:phosphocarrier protein HPr
MKTRVVVLKSDDGLHARPAAILVKKAGEFKSKIDVVYQGTTKSARSVMGLMSLGLPKGAEVTFNAEGEDADLALDSLAALIENNFTL